MRIGILTSGGGQTGRPGKGRESRAEESKERGKEKEQRFRALTAVSLYRFLYRFIAPRGIWAPFGHHLPKKHH